MDGVMTVTQVNEYARTLLASDALLRNICVRGEISGYKLHYSGHRYFSLKDGGAVIRCALYRHNSYALSFEPCDGMQVVAQGSVSLYVEGGQYQLYVNSLEKEGIGDLYVRFEHLKNRLAAEGLFDPARKRQIPFFPKNVGLVTSKTGAAVRDMIHVLRRRCPNVNIVISPCAVQGADAGKDIARAIDRINRMDHIDVLLVGRGGGSIEDLWAFNEEIVARAIARSAIPVISCVGHETDSTIADFVADLRAPTPSAAAELAVPDYRKCRDDLDALVARLSHALERGQRMRRLKLEMLTGRALFTQPEQVLIAKKREALTEKSLHLTMAWQSVSLNAHRRLDRAEIALRTLNPRSVMQRGYAYVTREDGHILTDSVRVQPLETLHVHMRDGNLKVQTIEWEGTEHGEEENHV